jgi:hypothetical protein
MSDIVNVGGGENWDASFAGGGPAESASQLVKAIMQDAPASAVANGVVLGLDLLGALESPLETLATSVIGWLLEHISYLDSFLDLTTGDPGAIDDAVKALNKAAVDLDELAKDHVGSMSEVPTYAEGGSGSFNAFVDRVLPRAEDIETRAIACVGLANAMAIDGAVVAALRGIIRDSLALLVIKTIKWGSAAIAAAPYTGGASMGALLTDVSIESARTARELCTKLADVGIELAETAGKVGKLVDRLDNLAVKNIISAGGMGAASAAARPELTADQAIADRRAADHPASKPAATPGPPWKVQGTLEDG